MSSSTDHHAMQRTRNPPRRPITRRIVASVTALSAALVLTPAWAVADEGTSRGPDTADEVSRQGDWIVTGEWPPMRQAFTLEMRISPRAESKPALRHRLLPHPFDAREGNAALFYLKAMGYLEQTAARAAVTEFQRQASEDARQEDGSRRTPAPYAWLNLPLEEFPVDKAKDYLRLLRFQEPFLAEAAERTTFMLDRDIRRVESPMEYHLPEIQSMRELARIQSLRFRVALREGRVEEAVTILGQQFAMAHHLGQDEFVVSNLVGAAIAGIAWRDALLLVQHEDAPNLYWPLAALPNPLTFSREGYVLEHNYLFLEVPQMESVDKQLREPGFWDQIAREVLDKMPTLDELGRPAGSAAFGIDDAELRSLALATAFAASFPAAKRFLIEETEMTRDAVESLDAAQAVLLAGRRHYEIACDNSLKWTYLPLWQLLESEAYESSNRFFRVSEQRDGWLTYPTAALRPALKQARVANVAADGGVALVRTVEAIRDHVACESELPSRLDRMRLPPPIDPFTGQPISYERQGDHAVVQMKPPRMPEIRLVLRLNGETQP